MKSFIIGVALATMFSVSAFAHEAPVDSARVKPAEKKADAQATNKLLKHSGGTDSRGCHTNHKTGEYHCHNPK